VPLVIVAHTGPLILLGEQVSPGGQSLHVEVMVDQAEPGQATGLLPRQEELVAELHEATRRIPAQTRPTDARRGAEH